MDEGESARGFTFKTGRGACPLFFFLPVQYLNYLFHFVFLSVPFGVKIAMRVCVAPGSWRVVQSSTVLSPPSRLSLFPLFQLLFYGGVALCTEAFPTPTFLVSTPQLPQPSLDVVQETDSSTFLALTSHVIESSASVCVRVYCFP